MDHLQEAAAFKDVYEGHFGAVLRYCLRRLPEEVASDAAAETFTIAWRRRRDFQWDRPLPWLYGVARRVVSNELRSEKRWRRLIQRTHSASTDVPGADAAVIEDDERDRVVASMSKLGATDREVLMLACWEGLSRRDLALALRCSENAASKRLHRALDRLGAELGVPGTSRQKFFRVERRQV
ncbi:MAG: sigma-70 family RNA polymerase sigma factor [Acidimicrobiia bacterium]|nr:sigma-70 family RNA polymerase sigma factor [Acidimicrobiia bacterium]